MSVQVGRRAELIDRKEQRGERATNEQGEEARRDERSLSEATASVTRRRPHRRRGQRTGNGGRGAHDHSVLPSRATTYEAGAGVEWTCLKTSEPL